MIVKNYMRDFCLKNPEILIFTLVNSIPKILIPKNGFPNFNLTNSLFHSYCIMNTIFHPMGTIDEEKNFDFLRKNNVWAFTIPRKNKGEVFLALRRRINHPEFSCTSIEHVIFHEIGHQFYYSNNVNVSELEEENLSDIYANACMINLFQKLNYTGYYENFSKRSMNILENIIGKKISQKNLFSTAELIYRKHGVI